MSTLTLTAGGLAPPTAEFLSSQVQAAPPYLHPWPQSNFVSQLAAPSSQLHVKMLVGQSPATYALPLPVSAMVTETQGRPSILHAHDQTHSHVILFVCLFFG